MENQTLKDKCKFYQKRRDYLVDNKKYILAHIDGRSFSKMVKNKFTKPFSSEFINFMNETAKYVCEQVQGVQFAYVQSDEITLVIKALTEESDVFFGGRLCKMQSIIASLATAKFNQLMTRFEFNCRDFIEPHDITKLPLYQFDCKVWDVDCANDVMAWLLFRNIDCVRNSKQQAAQTYIAHKELMNLDTDAQIKLLAEKHNIHWEKYKEGEKYGRFLYKEEEEKSHTYIDKNGDEITEVYKRRGWRVHGGMDLTNEENRKKLLDVCPTLNIEEK